MAITTVEKRSLVGVCVCVSVCVWGKGVEGEGAGKGGGISNGTVRGRKRLSMEMKTKMEMEMGRDIGGVPRLAYLPHHLPRCCCPFPEATLAKVALMGAFRICILPVAFACDD